MAGRLDSTLEIRGTANYILSNFYIQNLADESIKVNQGDIIGRKFHLMLSPIRQHREDLIRLVEAATVSKLNYDTYTTVTAFLICWRQLKCLIK